MPKGYTAGMHPTQLGPYTIGTRLGRGGMGAVYEATDDAGRRVAVKVLAAHLADDPGLRRRFDAEIVTLKTLRHPGIVQLLAFGEEDDQPYFAMELVSGQSLEQMLRAGRRFTCQETVSVALAVARALKAAHDHGVVHRDLKPANLLVANDAGGELGDHVKLADFGIARLFGGATHTAHGNIVGTAEYMAPEQAGGGPVDHRVDLYALGLVMFAMLAGRPPFTGGLPVEIIRRQKHEPAPRVSSLAPDVPPELDLLIDRLLAKDPAARPANALALGRLLTALDTLLHTQPDPGDGGPLTELPLPTPGERPAADIDLFAPTQAATAGNARPGAAHATRTLAATGAAPGNTTKQADVETAAPAGTGTSPAATTIVERAPRNRFTTVEELDRLAKTRADRGRAAEHRWQALAAVVAVSIFGAVGYLLFRPLTADELFARIEVAAGQGGDLRDSSATLAEFVRRFPDDARAGKVGSLARSLDVDALEKRARRRPLGTRSLTPLERDYRAAMDREAESPSACREALEALVALHPAGDASAAGDPARPADDPSLWLDLARRQIERLGPLAAREQAEDARRIDDILRQAADLAAQAARAVGPQQQALLARRRTLLESVVDLYGTRPHAAAAVDAAKKLLAE